ncbi:tripartite motif-containing protein 45 isoform X1 [Nasonia vitripennis]|uniref:Tripartite motif-containing protein 45 n=1 Tax=Nasonia vitripennis TaxID=7425 RepID=A0A7M7Q2Q8_NASVI|nr:tripartite motif-containing protein 45 isoform X1 [Nasonia vitripennis]XP_031778966.1 tripartite motif-containing protein 45 isoform X1 [Nasonia vitripennis]XP_031778967.1 tripartite motif-containing protein 45 isoform X1 [Nasonia vitripennis]XP_031778968.1 tripartite motif-containing protein 45 isoform X1 [Nasonia vitripennis]
MDKENSDSIRNKGGKETFIFGSWKCRNPRKTRVCSGDLVSSAEREKSPYTKRDPSNQQTALASSSSVYNISSIDNHKNAPISATEQEQNEINATATSSKRAISVYDQLHEQDFWCPRCSGKMEEPRLLPCLHSVCNNCVNEFTSKDYHGSSRVTRDDAAAGYLVNGQLEGCPICDFPLPKHGGATPPPHYSLQHRLVIYAVRRRLSQRAICCDACAEEVQATQHCSSCLCNFCQDCAQEHESHAPDQRVHRIRPLWEAKRIRRVAVCLAHPAHPLRFHCLACQQVTCKECMWHEQGGHRAHASEDAASAGARAVIQLQAALRRARSLLNALLTEYNERVFDAGDARVARSHTAFDYARDSLPPTCHVRSRSTISSQSREAKERIQEFSRLRRARYLIDAIFIGEDLLANGSDVEILSLKRIILKRLKFLGVAVEAQAQRFNNNSANKKELRALHSGIYHCCTFCSSGGKKEATCACSGTMPARDLSRVSGGYKGCGHGHPGHPGLHHWSCCGSIYRDGICLLPRKCTFKITL